MSEQRDTQFLGSAKSLQNALRKVWGDAPRNNWTQEEVHSRQCVIIARYAYDVACHAAKQSCLSFEPEYYVQTLVPDLEDGSKTQPNTTE